MESRLALNLQFFLPQCAQYLDYRSMAPVHASVFHGTYMSGNFSTRMLSSIGLRQLVSLQRLSFAEEGTGDEVFIISLRKDGGHCLHLVSLGIQAGF